MPKNVLSVVIYWRRYNGDYIVFHEKGEEFVAEYLTITFSLFKLFEREEWTLRFHQLLSPTAAQEGSCGKWDHFPSKEEVGVAIEKFIDRLNLHQED